MVNFHALLNFLKHRLKSTNKHGVHSPFIYEIVTEILEDKGIYYCFDQIEELREKLLNSPQMIAFEENGAGSKKMKGEQRPVRELAKYNLASKGKAQFLFRLAKHLKSQRIIELGTSLGITTCYFASLGNNQKVYSIEGCQEVLQLAMMNAEHLNLENIKFHKGTFKSHLHLVLQKAEQADFVFFDGHHEEQATLDYFNQAIEFSSENSVFVFDDIYWSKGMTNAWKKICAHPKVQVSMDLYFLGIVFFKKDQVKEHFTIRTKAIR